MNFLKKFPLFAVLCTLLFSAVSCKDDEQIAGPVEFSVPQVSGITATSAVVACRIESDAQTPLTGRVGVAYGLSEDDDADFERIPCAVESGVAECRLSGLSPQTRYRFFFYLQANGDGGTQSRASEFTTEALDEGTPVIDLPDKRTVVEADAAGGPYSIAYEIRNAATQEELRVEGEVAAWLHSFDIDGRTVGFQVDANTGEERMTQFDLTYPDAQPVTITVRQQSGTVPVIEVADGTNIAAAAVGGVYTLNYRVQNPTPGAELSVSGGEAAWVHSFDTSSQGALSFTVDANTTGERTARFDMTYPGAQPVTVTVKQAAGTSEPPLPGYTVTLTRDMAWPDSYQTVTRQLGGYEFYLSNVAIYNEQNGIQFKSQSGYIANKDEFEGIEKVELVYASGDSNKNFLLYVGDSEKPDGQAIQAQAVEGVYTYDCSAFKPGYFKLANGDGAGYLSEIRIYVGGGDQPAPYEPSFKDLAAGNISANSATLTCNFSYSGSETVSEAGFRYAASSGAEQTVAVSAATGIKSAALTGLIASTTYSWYFYAVVGGKLYQSSSSVFTTHSPGGDPTPSGTYHSGWAELPVQVEKQGDYYYAYHLRADKKSVRNYSVCYSKELGCPVWVAAPMHSSYKGNSGRTNSYSQDPDLGCTQIAKRSGYTRGHMLGSSDRTISKETNRQVFYYSNIGPQLQDGFNQGGGAWNNLEEWVDGKWCADTLYQVIGCYWKDKNKKVDGTVIPTHYYKVLLRTKKGNSGKWVSNCTSSELMCAAFLVEHKSQKGLKPSRNMMLSVAELERMTGFTFFANVPNAPKSEMNPSDWGL